MQDCGLFGGLRVKGKKLTAASCSGSGGRAAHMHACWASVAWPEHSNICFYRQSKRVKMSKSPGGHVTPRMLPTHVDRTLENCEAQGHGLLTRLPSAPNPSWHPSLCLLLTLYQLLSPSHPQTFPHLLLSLCGHGFLTAPENGCSHVPLSLKLYGFCTSLICLDNKLCQPAH